MITEKLDLITIRGFRSIAAIEQLELRPLNVLIGANGSGKTNFLAFFSFIREIREGRLQDYVAKQGGANRVLHFGARVTPQVQVQLWFSGLTNGYELSLGVNNQNQLYPTDEQVSFWDRSKYQRPYIDSLTPRAGGMEAGISDPALTKTPGWVRLRLAMWVMYHYHDTSALAPLRQNSHIHDNIFLRPDGSNLASFLYLLRQQHPDSYGAIHHAIQRVTPFFDDFVLEPLRLQPEWIRLQWRHKGSDEYFDVAALSDGTLRFIALATLLLQPQQLRPPIILIDEPELGLHPAAITMLGSLVRMASQHSQVILSTQSSLFLDQFEPQDIVVAEREGMTTQLRHLDPNLLKDWLEDYSLGQLWEKNELGGRP